MDVAYGRGAIEAPAVAQREEPAVAQREEENEEDGRADSDIGANMMEVIWNER